LDSAEVTALDASRGLAWALGDDLWDVQDELVELEDHRQTIMELVNLYWLADSSEALTTLVSKLQRRAVDLRSWALEHAPEEDGVPRRTS